MPVRQPVVQPIGRAFLHWQYLLKEILQTRIDFLPLLQLHPMRRVKLLDPQILRPRPNILLLQNRNCNIVFLTGDEESRLLDMVILLWDSFVISKVDVGHHCFVPAKED